MTDPQVTNQTIMTINETATSIAVKFGHQVCDVLAWMDVNPTRIDINDLSAGYDAQGYDEMHNEYARCAQEIADSAECYDA